MPNISDFSRRAVNLVRTRKRKAYSVVLAQKRNLKRGLYVAEVPKTNEVIEPGDAILWANVEYRGRTL
jgi:hypothetical protein